jgi:hypothetical protein
MSVYRVLHWSCPSVSRVLLFSETSIGYQYRVNARSKRRVLTTCNFKYLLLCILICTTCAEYADFGCTLLETSANNPDFHSCSWKIPVKRTWQFSVFIKLSLISKDQPFQTLLIINAYLTLTSKKMHRKCIYAALRLSI